MHWHASPSQQSAKGRAQTEPERRSENKAIELESGYACPKYSPVDTSASFLLFSWHPPVATKISAENLRNHHQMQRGTSFTLASPSRPIQINQQRLVSSKKILLREKLGPQKSKGISAAVLNDKAPAMLGAPLDSTRQMPRQPPRVRQRSLRVTGVTSPASLVSQLNAPLSAPLLARLSSLLPLFYTCPGRLHLLSAPTLSSSASHASPSRPRPVVAAPATGRWRLRARAFMLHAARFLDGCSSAASGGAPGPGRKILLLRWRSTHRPRRPRAAGRSRSRCCRRPARPRRRSVPSPACQVII